METKEKILLGLIGTVVGAVIVANITNAQGAFSLFGVDYSLIITSVLLLVLLLLFSVIPRISNKLGQIRNKSRKKKTYDHLNLDLYAGKLNEIGFLDLVIQNNVKEKPFITINAAYIDHLDHRTYRSRISKDSRVEVKTGNTRTARFIKEEKNGSFTIITHAEHSENPVYSFGSHRFVAIIVYGLESNQNTFTKCFQILVRYRKLHDFEITTKPVSCGRRETKFLITER